MTNDEIRDEFPSRRFYFEDSGQGLVQKQLRMVRHPHPGPTGIELRELRQVRSADFSPLPAVLAGRERGGLKSALLNSMAVGPGRGAAKERSAGKVCVWRPNQEWARGAGFIPQERRHCRSALGNFKAPSLANLPAD